METVTYRGEQVIYVKHILELGHNSNSHTTYNPKLTSAPVYSMHKTTDSWIADDTGSVTD